MSVAHTYNTQGQLTVCGFCGQAHLDTEPGRLLPCLKPGARFSVSLEGWYRTPPKAFASGEGIAAAIALLTEAGYTVTAPKIEADTCDLCLKPLVDGLCYCLDEPASPPNEKLRKLFADGQRRIIPTPPEDPRSERLAYALAAPMHGDYGKGWDDGQ